MKKIILFFIMALQSANASEALKISSSDFKDGQKLAKKFEYNGFGCDGQNIAPSVKWQGAPEDTKSFAFTVYDPDAPTGSGWWHFVAYNISASTKKITRAKLPDGAVVVANDGGAKEYMGPCPPKGHGDHHYVFTIYALNVEKLELPENASPALVGYMINQHKISSAQIVATYQR